MNIIKRVGVSKKQVSVCFDDINVEVPAGTSDKAVTDAIENAFDVEVTTVDNPQLDDSMVVSHKLTRTGQVIRLSRTLNSSENTKRNNG